VDVAVTRRGKTSGYAATRPSGQSGAPLRRLELPVGGRSYRRLRGTSDRPRQGENDLLMNPEYANLTDLEYWAKSVASRPELPTLLRRLILSTAGVDVIRAPSGDAVGEHGWDIELDAPIGREPWIPGGASRWEGGVGGDPQEKAQSDFAKRTRKTPREVQGTQTFVFFTPRRWDGDDSQKWIDRKLAETTNSWAGIRVVDGVQLVSWLETQPGVHIFASELVGKKPTEVELLSRRWERWSAETAPALPPEVLLAGRAEQAEALTDALLGPATEFRIGSDTVGESLAFFAAAMPEALLTRAVVVTGAGGWLRLATHNEPLILVPTFEDPDAPRALAAGHHVLIPEGPRSRKRLPRIEIQTATAAFEAAGVERQAAADYAHAARRSLSGLRRRLGRSGPLREPDWADGPATAVLAPLLLAGAWVDRQPAALAGARSDTPPADLAGLQELTGTGWRDLSRSLQGFVNRADPPLRVEGGRWEFLDLVDAWELLSPAVTGVDLMTFHQLVIKVVTEPDPVLDLPVNERMLAGVRRVRRTHSPTLRAAMAGTVAALGAVVGERVMQDGVTGQEHAKAAVHALLANDDPRAWISVADVLPDLAEAAPTAFLTAVERALEAPGEPLAALFASDAGDPGLSGSGARHHHLLWALERLASSPRYIGRALLATARLVELDDGRSKGNTPIGSLFESLHLWFPQAAITRSSRRDILDLLRRKYPAVAWRLLVGLVPSTVDVGVMIRGKARWRDWEAISDPTPNALFDGLGDLADLLAEEAGDDLQRLRDLVDVVPRVPPQARVKLLGALRDGASSARPDVREDIARLLAEEVTQHRRFADAAWAMSEEEVADVTALALELDPGAMTPPDVDWFAYWPRRGIADANLTPQEADELVERERRAAVERLFAAGGLQAVINLAGKSEVTYPIGVYLAALDLGDDEPTLLGLLTGPEPVAQAVRGYAAEKYRAEGLAWLERPLGGAASEDTAAEILRSCPASPGLLELVDGASQQVRSRFWLRPPVQGVAGEHLPVYLERLLAHDRPWTALTLLIFRGSTSLLTPALTELALRVLKTLRSTEQDASEIAPQLQYDFGHLLDELDATGADADRLASIEWWFQPALRHVRQPRALFRQLGESPELFVQLVVAAFRPASAADDDDSADDETAGSDASDRNPQVGQAAFDLLRSWHVLPATSTGAILDGSTLETWVVRAEALLTEADRGKIGRYCIGEALAGPVTDDDGTWPSAPVRHVLEIRADPTLEEGLYVARKNQRGATTRGFHDGGQQERDLADQYQAWADRVRSKCPRTAALLDALAEGYRAEGRWHDERRDRP
jgi:hypothetical protein